MNKFYFTIISIFVLCSCGTKINYLGTTSSPTSHIDVFVDPSSIKKPYEIIGKGYIEYGYGTKGQIERMLPKAVAKAKEKGADAILFKDYYLADSSTDVYTVSTSDSSKNGSHSVTSTSARPIVANKQEILFLKYSQ